LTGQIVWPVSVLLSHYLATLDWSGNCNNNGNSYGKTLVELGAGVTALPSFTAASLGAATVVATDGNDGVVLDLLRANMLA
jgi:predicted RNA methylase